MIMKYDYNKKLTYINAWLATHKSKVELGTQFASTVVECFKKENTNKSVILAHGAFALLKQSIINFSYTSSTFFSPENGWAPIQINTTNLSSIFIDTIRKFPQQSIASNNSYEYSIFTLPVGVIGLAVSGYYKTQSIHCRETADMDAIISFLVAERFKEFNTKFISVDAISSWDGSTCSIHCEEINAIPSVRCDEYCDYIRHCHDLGINRSFIFYGAPGTGKTTLTQSIIKQLNFKTLKFKYCAFIDYNAIQFLIEIFKIDAVIIDDFDQVNESNEMLEFLEFLKRKTKLVIALVNSLKKFHLAILRPGRFDQIVKVNYLDKDTINKIVGEDLFVSHGDKIKYWPVAYINEFVIRNALNKDNIETSYLELQERVNNQIALLSDGTNSKVDSVIGTPDESPSVAIVTETVKTPSQIEIETIVANYIKTNGLK